MIAPTLLVGLGGTGSKIVARVSRLADEEQRKHLAFAVFDTDINELRDIQRANPEIKIVQTSTRLSVGEYLNIDHHARDNWFPVNAILNSKTLTEGAGQVRAISRLAFDTAIRAGKMEQLHEAIQNLYKIEEGEEEQALRVVIVSSLAGGTGSGLILPVALYIKNYLATHFRQSANITRGFFILPEVFFNVIPGEAERNNLKSNAYATLRELDAFIMKGDHTLPKRYESSVRMEFPRVSSKGYEEYQVRPYDFCFLFDAQNAEGRKLNSFSQYLDHAANCIYAQSIGPMNKRSNSSEDNTIRRLTAEKGRNRYAGAGASMLIYPAEAIEEYIALNWAKANVSDTWLEFDHMFKAQLRANAQMRAQGLNVIDPDPISNYITSVDSMAQQKNDPFARSIINACAVYDESGLTKVDDKWNVYIGKLKERIEADLSNEPEVDGYKDSARAAIADCIPGDDIWEKFASAYDAMEKYRALIDRVSEDRARTIAFTLFHAPTENAAGTRSDYDLEKYLRDGSGNFMHPNAVRYFLYKTLGVLQKQEQIEESQNKDTTEFFRNFAKRFDDTKTEDVVETAADLTMRKESKIASMLKRYTGDQEDLRSAYSAYMTKCDEYRVGAVMEEVLKEGIKYVKSVADAFERFYGSFETRVHTLNDRMENIVKKYTNVSGTTARYVCASKKCLDKFLAEYIYMGNSLSIDTKLAEEIYNKVRSYSQMLEKPANDSYFVDLFDNGIVKFFKDSVVKSYGSAIDIDVISALEKECQYEKEEYDTTKIDQYVKKVLVDMRGLSTPFIEKPLGEERDPIYACAYNPCINPHDTSRRGQLVSSELGDHGGVEDKDIGKNTILFYQSFYGLRANDLSKFAPPESTETSVREGGEYFKAYYELVGNVNPNPQVSKAITPHIDRWWHVVTKMPDLDDGNQKKQENEIYAAFFWGLVSGLVRFTQESNDTRVYKLDLDKLRMTDLPDTITVSNGTPCDHLYEVMDAVAIYPELIRRIMKWVRGTANEEADCGTEIDDTTLMGAIRDFWLKELPLRGVNREMPSRSILDLPLLMKKSVKSEEFDEEMVLQLLRVELSEVRKYCAIFLNEKEVRAYMDAFLKEQYTKFMEDLEGDFGPKVYDSYLSQRIVGVIEDAFIETGDREKAREIAAEWRKKEAEAQ